MRLLRVARSIIGKALRKVGQQFLGLQEMTSMNTKNYLRNLGKVLPSEYAEFIEKLERYQGIRNDVEYSPVSRRRQLAKRTYPEIDKSLKETAEQKGSFA